MITKNGCTLSWAKNCNYITPFKILICLFIRFFNVSVIAKEIENANTLTRQKKAIFFFLDFKFCLKKYNVAVMKK